MNIFEFIERVIMFASTGFSNFLVSLIFVSLIGILCVSFANAIFSNFKLFEINKKEKSTKHIPSFNVNSETTTRENITGNNIYDLLIKAWEKHKKNKDN